MPAINDSKREMLAASFMAAMIANDVNTGTDMIELAEDSYRAADAFMKVSRREAKAKAESSGDPICQHCAGGNPLAFGQDACEECLVADTIKRA